MKIKGMNMFAKSNALKSPFLDKQLHISSLGSQALLQSFTLATPLP